MPWLDPIGGAMVGYTILKAGYDICKDAMREALDVSVCGGFNRSSLWTRRRV